MKNIFSVLLCLACLGLAVPVEAAKREDASPLTQGRLFFEKYIRMERTFDPRLADLYAPEAIIEHRMIRPNGKEVVATLPADTYKEYIRAAMPLAEFRGEYAIYSDITYLEENGGIRIKAARYAGLNGGHSPLSILLLPSPDGKWLIYEEYTESRTLN